MDTSASDALFDALAGNYEEHFAAPHRWAYDELAWQASLRLIDGTDRLVVDVGCGVGRWAERLVALGHRVIGIEPAPAMRLASERRAAHLGGRFRVMAGRAEDVELPEDLSADLALAMGSLQYADDPVEVLRRAHGWLRPGGAVAVVVDSLAALVLELLRAGKVDEAIERARTRRALWAPTEGPVAGLSATHHLFDRTSLAAALGAAGFVDVSVGGLLVSASAVGVDGVVRQIEADPGTQLAVERELAAVEAIADAGKQLLGIGRKEDDRG